MFLSQPPFLPTRAQMTRLGQAEFPTGRIFEALGPYCYHYYHYHYYYYYYYYYYYCCCCFCYYCQYHYDYYYRDS